MPHPNETNPNTTKPNPKSNQTPLTSLTPSSFPPSPPHTGKLEECNQDLVTVYRQHFERAVNATNLGLLVDAYIRRTDLGIVRELDPNKKKVRLDEGEPGR